MSAEARTGRVKWLVRFVVICALYSRLVPVGWAMDLTGVTIVATQPKNARQVKAVAVLVEEVEKRTGVRWNVTTQWPNDDRPVIALGSIADAAEFCGAYANAMVEHADDVGKEGYCLFEASKRQSPAILLGGRDDRGVFYGVGRLLREMTMERGKIELAPFGVWIATPESALRGHQLGYRPKTNSYDGWDVPQWEQYIRDLVVFGTNAIELVPPRTDDAATSPHFPRPQLEMMREMSRIADEYDVDVWVWFPALDREYDTSTVLDAALHEWGEVFAALPRLDAVFVPGGDPGRTPPQVLLRMLDRQVPALRSYHAAAQVWVSPQSFNQEWLDEFIKILRDDPPLWLHGVVYGPQVRVSLPTLRRLIPERLPIRHYPDITHSRQCQYPVADWDVAYALTAARESINPRPVAQAQIFRLLQPNTIGFLTYSEGCNDDVNKFIWSGLGWDAQQPILKILREYSGYFIGAAYRETFAQGLLALERNWQGPLLTNTQVDVTWRQFQTMERTAPAEVLKNWRFLMGLYRAYYDAYVRQRLLYETDLQQQALRVLDDAPRLGARAAMDEAQRIFQLSIDKPVAVSLRTRAGELADELFATIKLQSSVTRHQAIAIDRGASWDTIDWPLNDRRWWLERFQEIGALGDEARQQSQLQLLLHRTDPGPGGFYDNLGNPLAQPHLVRALDFARDPASLESARVGFEEAPDLDVSQAPPWPLAWIDYAETLLEFPLRMRYTDLDPSARYTLRVIYAGDGPQKKIRLVANHRTEIHPYVNKPNPVAPLEFELPAEVTRTGELNLSWYREPGLGDNGRGCQVSEVWLIRRNAASR